MKYAASEVRLLAHWLVIWLDHQDPAQWYNLGELRRLAREVEQLVCEVVV